jgi:hypothetical protein
MADLATIIKRLQPALGPVRDAPMALDGGLTNRNHRARFAARDYMIRLVGRDTARRLGARSAEVLPLSAPAPCHDGLLPASNVQIASSGGPRPMLVDWECAGMGHRVFDLGNLAVNNEFDETVEEPLLAAYFGAPAADGEGAALKLMRIMSDAREAAWGVIQESFPALDFDFAGYAHRHFGRLAEAAGDPRLEEWLDAARA